MEANQPNPLSPAETEFQVMLTTIGEAMNGGRLDDARSAMLDAFQHVAATAH